MVIHRKSISFELHSFLFRTDSGVLRASVLRARALGGIVVSRRRDVRRPIRERERWKNNVRHSLSGVTASVAVRTGWTSWRGGDLAMNPCGRSLIATRGERRHCPISRTSGGPMFAARHAGKRSTNGCWRRLGMKDVFRNGCPSRRSGSSALMPIRRRIVLQRAGSTCSTCCASRK